MQPCDELENIVLQHYGKFHSGEQASTIQATYSLQDGVVIIGSDPGEWVEDREGLNVWVQAGGAVKAEITVQNIRAMCEGSVGWTMDRVKVRLPNGVEIPIRHTRIFHKEDGVWKMVHLHVSVAVPDKKIDLLYS
jgi:SnoaL-like domain